jgi:hypothetical protein
LNNVRPGSPFCPGEARGAEEGGWRGDVDAAPQTGL